MEGRKECHLWVLRDESPFVHEVLLQADGYLQLLRKRVFSRLVVVQVHEVCYVHDPPMEL